MESQTRRNLMVSNFVGSFVGGVAGIFTAFLLSPAWMPGTILVGVLVGWLHKNIFSATKEIGKRIQFRNRLTSLKQITASFIELAKVKIDKMRSINWLPAEKIQKVSHRISRIRKKAIIKTIRAGRATKAIPGNILNWWKEHSTRQALALRGLAFTMVFAGTATALWFTITPSNSDEVAGWVIMATILFSGLFILQAMPSAMAKNTEMEEMKSFYQSWEKISKHGKGVYFLREAAKYSRQAIGISLFLAISLSWLFTIAMIGMLGIYVAIVFLVTARATWKAVMRYRFWVCYGVTLSATFMSWFIYHDSINNLLEVGLLAVSTGVISGVVSLVTQVALEKFYRRTSFGRRLATEGMDSLLLADRGSYTSGMTKFAAVWFRQNRLSFAFRKLCLGTPLVKPVKIV